MKENLNILIPVLSLDEFGDKNLDLCDTSSITLHSQWYQLIPPLGTCFSVVFSTTLAGASTSDITTLPVIFSNIIFQEVGNSENSILSSSLQG
jgi:hypothetical protein